MQEPAHIPSAIRVTVAMRAELYEIAEAAPLVINGVPKAHRTKHLVELGLEELARRVRSPSGRERFLAEVLKRLS